MFDEPEPDHDVLADDEVLALAPTTLRLTRIDAFEANNCLAIGRVIAVETDGEFVLMYRSGRYADNKQFYCIDADIDSGAYEVSSDVALEIVQGASNIYSFKIGD